MFVFDIINLLVKVSDNLIYRPAYFRFCGQREEKNDKRENLRLAWTLLKQRRTPHRARLEGNSNSNSVWHVPVPPPATTVRGRRIETESCPAYSIPLSVRRVRPCNVLLLRRDFVPARAVARWRRPRSRGLGRPRPRPGSSAYFYSCTVALLI